MSQKFKEYKLICNSVGENKKIQNLLIQLGYFWAPDESDKFNIGIIKKPLSDKPIIQAKYLFTNKEGYIQILAIDNEEDFNTDKAKLLTIDDLEKLLKKKDKPVKETKETNAKITINSLI